MNTLPLNRDKSTLRECGVTSGDTLTIQVPEPLPFHVQVKLEFEFVDFANSKLHGQDTLIFIVDLYTETIGSLLERVAARLDCKSEEIRMMIKTHGETRTYHDYDSLYHMGIESGDCAFKCHKKGFPFFWLDWIYGYTYIFPRIQSLLKNNFEAMVATTMKIYHYV